MEAFDPQLIVLASMWWVVFVFSTTCHEAAHAWAALKGGDPTAYHGGQVSLDPLPHIQREPFGMVVVPLLVFFLGGGGWMVGWASTPYDPLWAARHPKRAAFMALAGPAANLALFLVAALAIRAGMLAGVFSAPSVISSEHFGGIVEATSAGGLGATAASLLGIFFTLNLVLFVFNLLPVPPLDGSGAMPLILGEEMAARYRELMHQPMMALVGLLIAWTVFGKVFWPIFFGAVQLLYPEMRYS